MTKTSKDKTNSKPDTIQAYTSMLKIRRMEETIAKLYSQKTIRGFCHLYIGQEAIAVGTKSASKDKDAFITSYRAHGHSLITGTSLEAIIAELLGKSTGTSKGKGGSMHMFNPKNHFYGGHGIVGAQVAIGTGIALSYQYQNIPNVVYVFLGDGALNQGQVYESLNMAKIWNLPVVYIIENNVYAMGTSISRACANSSKLYERGLGFDIYGRKINGMDYLGVKQAMSEAREYALNKGPIIIEASTYRYRGHSMSDPAKYRTRDEVEDKKKNYDPIANLSAYMTREKICKEDDLKQINEKIKQEIADALNIALEAPYPDISELFTDIYQD